MSEEPTTLLYEDELKLTLGDRINYPYLMGEAIRTFLQTTVKAEGEESPQEILNAALNCLGLIPDGWRIDKEFETDLKRALIITRADSRKSWCGVRVGSPNYSTKITLRPDKLFHAVINLLQRRGLMEKTIFREIFTGKVTKKEEKELAEKPVST